AQAGLSHDHRVKIARLIRAQRLHIKTLIGQHEEALAESARLHRIDQQALKTELQDSRRHLEQLKVQNEQLKSQLVQQDQEYAALQQQLMQLEARLGEVGASARDSAQRSQIRLEAELVILKEQLARRESELLL